MTTYGTRISARKGARLLQQVAPALLSGEQVTFVCGCTSLRPPVRFLLVTTHRVIGWSAELAIEFRYLTPVTVGVARGVLTIADARKSHTFWAVSSGDQPLLIEAVASAQEALGPDPARTVRAAFDQAAPTPQERAADQVERAGAGRWPDTTVVGNGLNRTVSAAVLELCRPGEDPWLILIGVGKAGLLIAWDDRISLVRPGSWTGFAKGPAEPGSETTAMAETYRLWELAGIEYAAGLLDGTLTFRTHTADDRDQPRMDLTKPEYSMARGHLDELRSRIVAAQEPVGGSSAVGPDVQAELRSLESLNDAGLMSPEEYARAKTALGG